jgi:YHS domain-containing protein
MNERCTVCGADLDGEDPPATTHFDGDLYYFCCEACKDEFVEDPARFVRSAA